MRVLGIDPGTRRTGAGGKREAVRVAENHGGKIAGLRDPVEKIGQIAALAGTTAGTPLERIGAIAARQSRGGSAEIGRRSAQQHVDDGVADADQRSA